MTERSRLIALMAQREANALASARRAFANAVQEQQAAASMSARLTALMEQKRDQLRGQSNVAQLRQHRHLASQLASEAERTRLRAEQMQEGIDAAMVEMTRKKHRKQVLDDAAKAARRAEAEAREEKREAARTPQIRK